MSRTIPAVAYFGVMKSTINDEEPIITVSPAPFSGDVFDMYVWYRVEAMLPIQPDVIGSQASKPVRVNEP